MTSLLRLKYWDWKERIQRLVALKHHCHHPFFVTSVENVDLFAGDFNGTACPSDNKNNISIIEEAFADCALQVPPSPSPLWSPGSIPGNWADVFKPPESDRHWKVRLHNVFTEQLHQRTESNCWEADGVRVEESPKIQDSGYPQRDSDNKMSELQCDPADYKDNIIFMSM